MKKLIFLAALIAILLIACKSAPKPPQQPSQPQQPSVSSEENFSDFSEITGKNWLLTEVRIDGKNTGFDRGALVRDGFGEYFTLRFDAENISGTGAPNRYSAPYTLGTGGEIDIMLVRATLMAPIREPDKLREHDFFNYVQNSYKWNLTRNNLELNSRIEDGSEVVLIFTL